MEPGGEAGAPQAGFPGNRLQPEALGVPDEEPVDVRSPSGRSEEPVERIALPGMPLLDVPEQEVRRRDDVLPFREDVGEAEHPARGAEQLPLPHGPQRVQLPGVGNALLPETPVESRGLGVRKQGVRGRPPRERVVGEPGHVELVHRKPERKVERNDGEPDAVAERHPGPGDPVFQVPERLLVRPALEIRKLLPDEPAQPVADRRLRRPLELVPRSAGACREQPLQRDDPLPGRPGVCGFGAVAGEQLEDASERSQARIPGALPPALLVRGLRRLVLAGPPQVPVLRPRTDRLEHPHHPVGLEPGGEPGERPDQGGAGGRRFSVRSRNPEEGMGDERDEERGKVALPGEGEQLPEQGEGERSGDGDARRKPDRHGAGFRQIVEEGEYAPNRLVVLGAADGDPVERRSCGEHLRENRLDLAPDRGKDADADVGAGRHVR